VAAASPYGTWAVAGAGSYCGDPLEGGKTQHAPCHACRIGGGADLPPPCPVAPPVLDAAVLSYDAVESLVPPHRGAPTPFARGPPAA
jgi:hypothetical protein